jgi:DNA repair protein RadC
MTTPNIAELVRATSSCSARTARRVADACQVRSLNTLTVAQLTALGATQRQAERLTAGLRLGERVHTAQSAQERGVRQPVDAVQAVRDRFDIGALEQEHFWVLALNARQKILDVFLVGVGSLAQVDVHPREVFKPLVRMSAHSCILVHNHPSNDAEPSDSDVQLTHRMAENGRMLGIPVLDHLVVTADDSVSMAALGLLPIA